MQTPCRPGSGRQSSMIGRRNRFVFRKAGDTVFLNGFESLQQCNPVVLKEFIPNSRCSVFSDYLKGPGRVFKPIDANLHCETVLFQNSGERGHDDFRIFHCCTPINQPGKNACALKLAEIRAGVQTCRIPAARPECRNRRHQRNVYVRPRSGRLYPMDTWQPRSAAGRSVRPAPDYPRCRNPQRQCANSVPRS